MEKVETLPQPSCLLLVCSSATTTCCQSISPRCKPFVWRKKKTIKERTSAPTWDGTQQAVSWYIWSGGFPLVLSIRTVLTTFIHILSKLIFHVFVTTKPLIGYNVGVCAVLFCMYVVCLNVRLYECVCIYVMRIYFQLTCKFSNFISRPLIPFESNQIRGGLPPAPPTMSSPTEWRRERPDHPRWYQAGHRADSRRRTW